MQYDMIPRCYRCLRLRSFHLLSNVKQGYVLVHQSHALHHAAIVSKSTDIFTNLALEDWLYNQEDFTNKSLLLLWRNGPSVVIGKHQNPWMECHVKRISEYGANLVRRKSGGGTVYHDMGNLNISVLTSRKRYDRRKNLDLVVEAVTSCWDISLDINNRHDILLAGMYKVSGTAAKVGRKQAFHHFTLVFDVDKERMESLLHIPTIGTSSKATVSEPTHVQNLCEEQPDISYDGLVQCISEAFLSKGDNKGTVEYVYPSDDVYPGITRNREALCTWDWIYGLTPPFTINRSFVLETGASQLLFDIYAVIKKGLIVEMTLNLKPNIQLNTELIEIAEFCCKMKYGDSSLYEIIINDKLCSIESSDKEIYLWIMSCVREALAS